MRQSVNQLAEDERHVERGKLTGDPEGCRGSPCNIQTGKWMPWSAPSLGKHVDSCHTTTMLFKTRRRYLTPFFLHPVDTVAITEGSREGEGRDY